MAEPQQIAEIAISYGTAVADLQRPLILEHDGQPLAVLISFEEYRRLRALESAEEQRQQMGWIELGKFLAEIHSRPTEYTPEQIEAEITAAVTEVRERRRARRSGG